MLTTPLVCALGLIGSVGALGPQESIEVVHQIEDPDALVARLDGRGRAIFADGDLLTFVAWSRAAEFELNNRLGADLKPHENDGYHLAQVRIERLDELLMSYEYLVGDETPGKGLQSWVGSLGPELFPGNEVLLGKTTRYALKSSAFGERRAVQVYEPVREGEEPLPVVYMTDGGAFDRYVGAVDRLIEQGRLAPLVLVGVHSGGYRGSRELLHSTDFDYRALEYLGGLGDERYTQHKRFLAEDVLPWVEQRHGASTERSARVLTGFSNGGAYAVTAGVEQSDLFGTVCAYSVAFFLEDALAEAAAGKELPRFRLAAGTLEHFMRGTRSAEKVLQAAGAEVELRSYVAGHDPLLWKVALLEDLIELFPGED